jgi:hypothetical protein
MMAFLSGDWKTAAIELPQAEQLFREQSALPYKLVVVQVYTLTALYYSGRIKDYFRRIPECLKESLDRGNVFAEANLRLQNAHRKCFGDDRPGDGLEELREAMLRWSPRGFLQVHVSEMFHRVDFALYQGQAAVARDTLRDAWPRLVRSLLLGLQTVQIPALFLRARAALAMASDSGSAALLKAAESDARRIEKEQAHWGVPIAQLIRACVAVNRGESGRALTLLQMAEAGFNEADMALHAAVVRSRRGSLVGGDEGRALVAGANQWMATQGLSNPARMTAMLAPGRWGC